MAKMAGVEVGKRKTAITKKSHNLKMMDHCIFCLRRTTDNDNGTNYHLALLEQMQEVPSAEQNPANAASLLFTLNKTWSFLRQGGRWNWGQDSNPEDPDPDFLCLPKMCRYCVELLESVRQAMDVMTKEVNRLGDFMWESRYYGKYSQRIKRFEKALTRSQEEWDCIVNTLTFLGKSEVETWSSEGKKLETAPVKEVIWVGPSKTQASPSFAAEALTESADFHNEGDSSDDGGLESDCATYNADVIKDENYSTLENDNDNCGLREPPSREITDNCADGMESDGANDDWNIKVENCFSLGNDAVKTGVKEGERVAPTKRPRLAPHLRAPDTTSKITSCDLCRARVHKDQRYDHVRKHVGEAYMLQCPDPECETKYFCTSAGLTAHVKYYGHGVLKADSVCELCGEDCSDLRKLRTHLTTHHESHSEESFPCPLASCEKKFSTRQSVALHLTHHRSMKDLCVVQACEKCKEQVPVEEMEKHFKDIHYTQDVIKCVQCPFLFLDREKLVDHMYVHRFKLPCCDLCGEDGPKFSQHPNLRKHYFQEHQVGTLVHCEKCLKEFFSREKLEAHSCRQDPEKAAREEEEGVELFPCTEPGCNKVYKARRSLSAHVSAVHTNRGKIKRVFSCEHCGNTFRDSWERNVHTRKEHEGIAPPEYPCQEPGCEKIFKKIRKLRYHVAAAHTGEKPHVCEHCGKQFALSGSLKKHILSMHTEDSDPFVCDVCGKRFKTVATLRVHKRSHADGNRPFSCESCGERFRLLSVFRAHMKTHQQGTEEDLGGREGTSATNSGKRKMT